MKKTTLLSVVALLALTACGTDNMSGVDSRIPADSSSSMTSSSKTTPVMTGDLSDLSQNVYFGYDQYSISSEAASTLKKQAAALKAASKVKVTIEGNADERGTRKYNFALGERRANSVKRYLVSQGVSASRISTVSFGKEKPVASGHDAQSWAKNRRAATVLAK